jgi:putative transport protein
VEALISIIQSNPVAQTIFALTLVGAAGLFLGSLRFFGISLEIAGVLFAGLFFGYLGLHLEPTVVDFVRDFGLVLFVYSIGIQVGPGFLNSMKRDGLKLNAFALSVVALGVLITILIHHFGGVAMATAVGLFSGATTNTPSLAAAQQALRDIPGLDEAITKLPPVGYAVAYPFGIMGIILTMLLTRSVFRIQPDAESKEYARLHEAPPAALDAANLIVQNPNLAGRKVSEIPALNQGIVISRIKHLDNIALADPNSVINLGDIILAVGPKKSLEDLKIVVGDYSMLDLRDASSEIHTKRFVVTQKAVLGRSVEEIGLMGSQGVTMTRLIRSDVELAVYPNLVLEFGDVLVCVGSKEGLRKTSQLVGNSRQSLNHPQLIPVFLGMTLGVLLGSIPFYVPGMPAPIKLGLAGGPLLVSLFLSRIRRIGTVIGHIPTSANFMMREIGIVLFLACVGLKSGDQFVRTISSVEGLQLLMYGALITFLPLMLVALVARIFFKMNFMSLCGLLAGSMTDPPALAFANSIASSSATSLSYATVYPLVMILRILAAQIMIMLFVR